MSRQPAKGSRAPAELFAFYLKAWNLDADPAELVDRVRAIEGVVRAEFNPQAKRLIVLSTLDQSVLLEALAGLGLEVEAEDGEEERQSPALPSPGAVRVRLRERLSERFPGADDWLRTVAWLVPASFLVGVLLSVLATVGRPRPFSGWRSPARRWPASACSSGRGGCCGGRNDPRKPLGTSGHHPLPPDRTGRAIALGPVGRQPASRTVIRRRAVASRLRTAPTWQRVAPPSRRPSSLGPPCGRGRRSRGRPIRLSCLSSTSRASSQVP